MKCFCARLYAPYLIERKSEIHAFHFAKTEINDNYVTPLFNLSGDESWVSIYRVLPAQRKLQLC